MKKKISIKVAGAAGQGVESGGHGLAKVLKRGGFHIFGVSDYMSLIKGGHNSYQITICDEPVYSHTQKFHAMLCFDPQNVEDNILETTSLHDRALFIVDDSNEIKPELKAALEKVNAQICLMPLVQIATDIGGNRIMANTVALGAMVSLMGLDFSVLQKVVSENFAKKSQQLADLNAKVAKAGYDYGLENLKDKWIFELPTTNNSVPEKMLINGNEAISFGSYSAGCRFISFYPMTPGTTAGQWFSDHNEKLGVVARQTEDEIAAICMAIGAAQVGARSMTTTSGGGFCLMNEALGLAGITEVPVVIINAMRGGPSTGLPTRTEQADLLYAIHASHGEFPKIVLAPGTIEQCYEAGIRAHNLAAKYQTPVIILTDLMLSSEIRDTDPSFFQIAKIDHGKFVTNEELDNMEEQYLRFKFTEDGISPRALQGHPKAVYAPATDEHDETGHITEDAKNRVRMMNKRMKKLDTALQDMQAPEWYGPEEADLTVIVWGSTYGIIREAIDLFNSVEGRKEKINCLQFIDMWPFPSEKVLAELKKAKLVVSVEQNYTSQLSKLLKMETGYEIPEKINRYDGRPFSPEEIVSQLEEVLHKSLNKA